MPTAGANGFCGLQAGFDKKMQDRKMDIFLSPIFLSLPRIAMKGNHEIR